MTHPDISAGRGSNTAGAQPATGCAVKKAVLPRPKVISVNGVVIARDVIARETQNHPATRPIDAWQNAARALVVRELLLQEAREKGIVAEPLKDGAGRRETDEEAAIRALTEQEIVLPEPDEETCHRIYQQRRQDFRSASLYAVRHILIAAPASQKVKRNAARREAEVIHREVVADPASFGDLAAKYSACPSKAMGGSLGQISQGQTVPEFERALADLPVGRVAEHLIESRYGFHIVLVEHRVDGEQLPFEAVSGQIADWLAARSRHTAVRQYIGMLAAKAAIEGIEFPTQ